jgi:RNase P/RNase MRP subunit POP5
MDEFQINDIRSISDFKGESFSKYKKTDVRKELLNCMLDGKIEPACNWGAELICAGQFLDLWDIILTFLGKHVHLANPKLAIYLEMRYEKFKQIISSGYVDDILRLRNNPQIRALFAEIICILCNTNKKHSFQGIKINKEEEYDITYMSNKLKAPSMSYAQSVYKKDDPKELFISINEFAYHISPESNNSLQACFWLEWIMEFQKICANKKEKCLCERRSNIPVDDKFQMDPIWIIWEIILQQSIEKDSIKSKILNSILKLYCLKYTPGVKKRRRYLIYYAISIITEKYDTKIEITKDKDLVETVVKKINAIYKQIKKNEVGPKVDYLMTDVRKSNLEKTIDKLQMLNKFDISMHNYAV